MMRELSPIFLPFLYCFNSRFSSRGNLTSSTDKMHGPIEAHPLNTLDGTVQLDDKEANPPATSFPVDIPANLPLYITKTISPSATVFSVSVLMPILSKGPTSL